MGVIPGVRSFGHERALEKFLPTVNSDSTIMRSSSQDLGPPETNPFLLGAPVSHTPRKAPPLYCVHWSLEIFYTCRFPSYGEQRISSHKKHWELFDLHSCSLLDEEATLQKQVKAFASR